MSNPIKLNRKVMMMKQKKQAKEMAEKDDHTWSLHCGTGVLNGTFGLQFLALQIFGHTYLSIIGQNKAVTKCCAKMK